eukprot:9471720-Pyramimonas_sp.AAC.2
MHRALTSTWLRPWSLRTESRDGLRRRQALRGSVGLVGICKRQRQQTPTNRAQRVVQALVGVLCFVGRHLLVGARVSLGKVAGILANAKVDAGTRELAPRNHRSARISGKFSTLSSCGRHERHAEL